MSIRSFFGDKIKPPSHPQLQQIQYSIDDVIKIKGLRLENSLGQNGQVLTANGFGGVRWQAAGGGTPGPPGPEGPEGPIGPQGEAGPPGLEPNIPFLIKDQDEATIIPVIADSFDNAGGFPSFDNINKTLTYTRLATVPENKFNFYTHSFDGAYGTNLNNLTTGRLAALMCDFTCVDVTTGDPRADPRFFFVVYTLPKFDGTDKGSFYNSKFVIAQSTSDDFIFSNVKYLFDPTHFVPIVTKISTSYTIYDVIGAINISSSSSEPAFNWRFSLNSLYVFTNGPQGPPGSSEVVATSYVPIAEKPFNYFTSNATENQSFEFPEPTLELNGRTMTVLNNAINDAIITLTSPPSGACFRDFYLKSGNSGSDTLYSSITMNTYKSICFTCLETPQGFKWCSTNHSGGVNFVI